MPEVLGLSFPTREEHYVVALGRCRELAVSIAAAAAVGEAADPDDACPEEEYVACFAKVLTEDVISRFGAICGPDLTVARAFGERLIATPRSATTQEEGAALLRHVRREVLPALANISAVILKQAAADQNAVLLTLQSRIDRLEGLFGSMNKVGRTIHLVAINAAIEAARAGGESGRIFATIATEIRNLSGEASHLVSRAQQEIQESQPDRPAEHS
jgi:hypothetical protein